MALNLYHLRSSLYPQVPWVSVRCFLPKSNVLSIWPITALFTLFLIQYRIWLHSYWPRKWDIRVQKESIMLPFLSHSYAYLPASSTQIVRMPSELHKFDLIQTSFLQHGSYCEISHNPIYIQHGIGQCKTFQGKILKMLMGQRPRSRTLLCNALPWEVADTFKVHSVKARKKNLRKQENCTSKALGRRRKSLGW